VGEGGSVGSNVSVGSGTSVVVGANVGEGTGVSVGIAVGVYVGAAVAVAVDVEVGGSVGGVITVAAAPGIEVSVARASTASVNVGNGVSPKDEQPASSQNAPREHSNITRRMRMGMRVETVWRSAVQVIAGSLAHNTQPVKQAWRDRKFEVGEARETHVVSLS
jgi:hypothetical protein